MELRFTVKRIFTSRRWQSISPLQRRWPDCKKSFCGDEFFHRNNLFISRKRNENAADTLSRLFLKGLLSRYCVRARKGTPDIHRSGPSVRAGMTCRSGRPHPPREPCCHMVNPRLALHQPRKRPVFFFWKIYLHQLLTVKQATKNAPKGVYWYKYIELLLCGYCVFWKILI